MKQSAFREAFRRSIPILCSYAFVGMAYGMMMAEAGQKWYVALLASVAVYTGAFQFVLVSFLAGGTSVGLIAITALLMNGRQLFYSITFLEDFSKMGWKKPLMIHTLTDETCAVNLSIPESQENRREVMFDIAMLSWLYWAVATVCGCIAGNLIPWDLSGIDFCMTALFVIILMGQWEQAADKKPALLGGGIALIALAIFGGSSFMLPALLATSAILLIPNRKGERAQ